MATTRTPRRTRSKNGPRLVVRPIRVEDLDAIQALHERAFKGDFAPRSRANLENHISLFPEGQLCVELDGEVVATSSSLIVDIEALGWEHTYEDVCQGGFLRRHDPHGDYLYGIDIAVDPRHRGMKLSRRLYDARKQYIMEHNLRGMIIGGRMPGFHRYAGRMSPREYLAKVFEK